MMNGISECCRYCKDRYPACHDFCDKYLEAQEQWNEHKRKVKAMKENEYDLYKAEAIKKQRRSKWQMK